MHIFHIYIFVSYVIILYYNHSRYKNNALIIYTKQARKGMCIGHPASTLLLPMKAIYKLSSIIYKQSDKISYRNFSCRDY